MLPARAKRPNFKSQTLQLVRDLTAKAYWDDLMYSIYARQKIETGLDDLKAGRNHSHASIRKEFGLT